MAFRNYCIFFFLVAANVSQVDGFVTPTQLGQVPSIKDRLEPRTTANRPVSTSTTTSLQVISLPGPFTPPNLIKIGAVFLASFFVTYILPLRFPSLWPGLKADPNVNEPLPPRGRLGCPWFGNNVLAGNQQQGANIFFRERSRRLGDPRVWMYYFRGKPTTSITGIDLIEGVNNMEFTHTQTIPNPDMPGLVSEKNRDEHSMMRHLVGQSMNEEALMEAVSTIQKTAQQSIENYVVGPSQAMSSTPVKMEVACEDFSFDVVTSQLLGLDLPTDEIPILREIMKSWIGSDRDNGFKIPFFFLRTLSKRKNADRSRYYVEALIGSRIKELVDDGPDTSTLSKMVLASELADSGVEGRSMTFSQVVDNTFGLIQGGVRPTAGILTLATLLLGIHTDKYQLLVKEQQELQEKHGYQLTYDMLDETNSPYLNAVVQETLRMGSGSKVSRPKLATKTIVVDGKQIPRGTEILSNYRLTHQLDGALRDYEDTHMDPYQGFHPERWTENSGETKLPSDYCPFGVGPRECLGAPMAMLQLKTFLAVFARRVASFDLVHGPHMDEDDEEEAGWLNINWNPRSLIPKPKDGVEILNVTTTTSDHDVEAELSELE